MKICRNLTQVITLLLLLSRSYAQTEPTAGRILNLNLDPQAVTSVELRPGFVTAVRLPEAVSSVVIGDPVAFKAEHSDAEPELVFFKPITAAASHTNALITTRLGRAVSLSLVSYGSSDHKTFVDYVLKYDASPKSFLIEASNLSFLVAQTIGIDSKEPDTDLKPLIAREDKLLAEQRKSAPRWQGKDLRASVGQSSRSGDEMTVSFSVLNSSARPIELLPPQIELTDAEKNGKHKPHKDEPVAIKNYQMTSRRLEPGQRGDGYVVFERPAFKTSTEHLALEIAQAEQVDRPINLPIPFVPATSTGQSQ
ncbi:MAG TPA: hypothetical protein VFA90_04075 [Terriglobales bacterium]|nr:hypothetical protein [Terriglobales bacterium]